MKRLFLNQIQAAQELGINEQMVSYLLAHKQIIGARKVCGRWKIPSPDEFQSTMTIAGPSLAKWTERPEA